MSADHTSQASGAPGALSEATTDEPRRSLEGVNPGPCISAFLVFAGAVQAVLTSGVIFGWAPLQMMLQEEGIYAEECANGPPCQEQAVRLQMIYTVASSAFCFCVWPTGLVLDTYGPRACCMMGAVFFGIGVGMFAVSDAGLDLFLPGFTMMAIGGLPVVLSMMHLSELLPAFAGTVMTIFNVMIDVSSLDLQIFKVVVDLGWCSRKQAFAYYAAVPIAIFVTAPFLWPTRKYEREPENHIQDVILESPRGGCEASAGGENKQRPPSRAAALKNASYGEQVRSKEFILCTAFTALQLLHINLYIGTVDDQMALLPQAAAPNATNLAASSGGGGGADLAVFLATESVGTTSPLTIARSMELHWHGSGRAFTGAASGGMAAFMAAAAGGGAAQEEYLCAAFSWILPLGGFVMTWPVGAILDKMPLSAGMFMLSLAAVLHSVFAMAAPPFDSPTLQLAGFVVFAYYRAALFGTMATTVALSFGHGNFGKLWGLLYAVAGCFNFGIAPIAMLAKTIGSYFLINCTSLVVSVVLMGYSAWLRGQEHCAALEASAYPRASNDGHSHHSGFGNDEYSSHGEDSRSRAHGRSRRDRDSNDLERGLLS